MLFEYLNKQGNQKQNSIFATYIVKYILWVLKLIIMIIIIRNNFDINNSYTCGR